MARCDGRSPFFLLAVTCSTLQLVESMRLPMRLVPPLLFFPTTISSMYSPSHVASYSEVLCGAAPALHREVLSQALLFPSLCLMQLSGHHGASNYFS